MTISVIDVTTDNSNDDNDNIRIDKPTGQDGDTFIAIIGGMPDQSGLELSGWTRFLKKDKGGIDRQLSFLYRIITDYASEPSDYNFETSDGNDQVMQGCIMCLRGVDVDYFYYDNQGQSDSEGLGNDASTPDVDAYYDDMLLITAVNVVGRSSGLPTDYDDVTTSGTDPTLVVNEGPNGYFNSFVGVYDFAMLGVAHKPLTLAGDSGGNFTWDINNPVSNMDEIGATIAIKSDSTPTPGTCTCNSICDNDCNSNQICSGNVSTCSNDYSFTTKTAGDLIEADDIDELETAINAERADTGRRFNSSEPTYCDTHTPGDLACSSNSFGPYSFTGARNAGDLIYAQHFTNVKNANNLVTSLSGHGSTITNTFVSQGSDPINSVITAADLSDLQDKINETRNTCICNSHCNCDSTDCGCDAECPSDDYIPIPP